MNLHALTYLFPGIVALALLFVPLIVFLYWRLNGYRKRVLEEFGREELLQPRSQLLFWTQVVLFCCVWCLAAFSLTQPMGNPHYVLGEDGVEEPVGREPQELIVMLDVSSSMGVQDTRTADSRLAMAKEVVDQLMQQSQGLRVSLFPFTAVAVQRVPATLNTLYARLLLRELSLNETGVPGTDFPQALGFVKKRQFFSTPGIQKTLVLLSDGGDTKFEAMKGTAERGAYLEKVLAVLPQSDVERLRVYTVGLGSREGGVIPGLKRGEQDLFSSLDEELLTALSRQGGGRYFAANAETSASIAEKILQEVAYGPLTEAERKQLKLAREGELLRREGIVYQSYFQISLGIALLLFALALLMPEGRRK